MIKIEIIPVLTDNYIYLLHDTVAELTAAVDPSEAVPVTLALRSRKWKLTHILNTHHHWDHTGGNLSLKASTECTIVGPRADDARIPGIDVMVKDGDEYKFGQHVAKIFDVPGHTRGHIAFWFEKDKALFCGDTLFSLGCGRMFEGTPEQMWHSLMKLRELPDDTRVFCGHEYTQENLRFAMNVLGETPALVAKRKEVDSLRKQGEPSIPSLLGDEKKMNPFLLAENPGKFGELRKLKDNFK